MESAKGTRNNGATPDVASFAEETLADIAAVVIPAIGSKQYAAVLAIHAVELGAGQGGKEDQVRSFHRRVHGQACRF